MATRGDRGDPGAQGTPGAQGPPGPTHLAAHPTRRTALRTGAIAGTAALTLALPASGIHARWARISLYGQSVARTDPGRRAIIACPEDLEPGTRIAAAARPDHRAQLVAEEHEVRTAVAAAGQRHGLDAADADLLLGAALDLHVLDAGLPGPVASWSPAWRYTWPRDAAHVAVAWARLGLTERAAGIVRTLAGVVGEDGWFEARYIPGTRRVPDDRKRQLDGTGWFLWALDEVAVHVPGLPAERSVATASARCAALLLRLTEGADALPPATPDSWELPESRLTIGSAALVAAGLERARRVLSDPRAAAAAERRVRTVRSAIAEAYGPDGYPRYAGRPGADAGMLFLLPPYALTTDADVARHVDAAQRASARPAGGVAPGALWREDGVSWTPQTALFAQARAHLAVSSGKPGRPSAPRADGADGTNGAGTPTGLVASSAPDLLRWLAAHRTAAGSLPEKVLADGSPASVAPLGWTAAVVVGALAPSAV